FLYTLLQERYTVMLASDGAQGIRLATKYIPDLVICDVMMPGIDGMETCRRIKQESVTSHIPVLMLTACSMDEQRIEGYKCGADAYISKPFDSGVLIARCEALLANRKRIFDHVMGEGMDSMPHAAAGSGVTPSLRSGVDDEFYQRFAALVEEDMADSDISVEDLAGRLGLSRVQLYRKIKAITNYSPAEMVRIMRLRRADRLLKTTESTVSEISYAVGFSSPSYFSKCYKDYFGESPTDVQRRTSPAR
ncbi:MAG: response regulator, partial [Muribaculaceae bacterium]|nr:response regulator [Muribaculaceae bacterium]